MHIIEDCGCRKLGLAGQKKHHYEWTGDASVVKCTHVVANITCSPRGSVTLFWHSWASGKHVVHGHTVRQTPLHRK